MTITIRRVIVWIASIGAGVGAVLGTLAVFQTNVARFSVSNTLLVFISIGALTFIWLDFILMTRYLRS